MRTGVVQRPKDKILSMDPKEITYEMVQKKLHEIAMARGKTTRIDRQEQVGPRRKIIQQLRSDWLYIGQTHYAYAEPVVRASLQIEMLTYLAGVTKGPVQKVEVLINIITVTFDMNQPTQASTQHISRRVAASGICCGSGLKCTCCFGAVRLLGDLQSVAQ